VEHVDGTVDPVRDFEMIETELLLADLQTLGKKVQKKGVAPWTQRSLPLMLAVVRSHALSFDASMHPCIHASMHPVHECTQSVHPVHECTPSLKLYPGGSERRRRHEE
jgi:hypothetical protein